MGFFVKTPGVNVSENIIFFSVAEQQKHLLHVSEANVFVFQGKSCNTAW